MAAVAKRACGFAPTFDFVAEVTTDTPNGKVTVREGGYSTGGAIQRAELAARARAMFAGFKRPVGFTADGYVSDTRGGAKVAIGFAS